ncbi:hypothetical protein BaRGS_00024299, partial [Batillaria attramentaria]
GQYHHSSVNPSGSHFWGQGVDDVYAPVLNFQRHLSAPSGGTFHGTCVDAHQQFGSEGQYFRHSHHQTAYNLPPTLPRSDPSHFTYQYDLGKSQQVSEPFSQQPVHQNQHYHHNPPPAVPGSGQSPFWLQGDDYRQGPRCQQHMGSPSPAGPGRVRPSGSASSSSDVSEEREEKASCSRPSALDPPGTPAPGPSTKTRSRRRKKTDRRTDSEEGTPLEGKQKFTREMIESVRARFPELHSKHHFVPPLRFFKTKYVKLKHYSTRKDHVVEQTLTDPSALIGDLTEDVVTRCVARLVEATEEPMFVLLNYQFDSYLFELGRKPVSKEAKKPSNVESPTQVSGPLGNESSKDLRSEVSEGSNGQPKENIPSESSTTTPLSPSSMMANTKTVQKSHQGVPRADSSENPFPVPRDLGETFKRGDFDILIVSRKLGFIIFEAKTMRGSVSTENKTQEANQKQKTNEKKDKNEEHVVDKKGSLQEKDQERSSEIGSRPSTAKTPQRTKDEELFTSCVAEDTDKVEGITDTDVQKTIEKGLAQLTKARKVLRHLVSDFPEDPTVTTVLALPNVPRTRLKKLAEDPSMQNAFTDGFETTSAADALSRCLCLEEAAAFSDLQQNQDGVPDPDGDDSMLFRWWEDLSKNIRSRKYRSVDEERKEQQYSKTLPSGSVPRDTMSAETYEEIIARLQAVLSSAVRLALAQLVHPADLRSCSAVLLQVVLGRQIFRLPSGCLPMATIQFCGRYSRLPEATTADCINLTGVCFGRSILREEQLNIMNSEDRFVFVIGPPGTGKTLVLGLKAAEWAMEGYHVIIVCIKGVNWGSLVSWTLHDRVMEKVKSCGSEYGRKRRSSSKCSVVTEEGDGDERKTQTDTTTHDDTRSTGKPQKGKETQKDFQPKESTEEIMEMQGGKDTPQDKEKESDMKTQEEKISQGPSKTQKKCKMQGNMAEVNETQGNRKTQDYSKTQGSRETHAAIQARHGRCDRKTQQQKTGQEDEMTQEGKSTEARIKTTADSSSIEQDNRSVLREPSDADAPIDYASFVHREGIYADTDIPKFVQEMLDKYKGGKGVKFILDECQKQATNEEQKQKLSSSKNTLEDIKSLYKTLLGVSSCCHASPREEEENLVARGANCGQRDARAAATKTTDAKSAWTRGLQNKWDNPFLPNLSAPPDTQPQSGHHQKDSKRKKKTKTSGTREASHSDRPKASASDQQLPLEEYFHKMDTRLDLLTIRIELLKTATGSTSFRSAGYWEESLRQLESLKEDAKRYRQEAECILEDIDKLMISALGVLFQAYHSLTFFVVDKLFAEVRQRQEEDGSRDISLWSSSVCPHYKPEGFLVKELGEILRCPPTVQEVMMLTEKDLEKPPAYDYVTRGCDANPPLPSDGPDVMWIDHAPHMTSIKEVIDCWTCGDTLADYLISTLGVGKTQGKKTANKGSLQPHDVIISGAPIHHKDCKFVQALKERGVRFEYERQDLDSPPPYPGKAFVT